LQLGFVIDQSRCIGCHACTVACKSENQVPVGAFRTWVKYVEEGEFPRVRRSFAVLRCNQCTAAPCVTICPVRALEKRPDGIVDVDPAVCIGCKACLQGCPYDALYLNEDRGTVEKCHFCAHRTERGLAPACAVVCPTEAIIPGDFDDPESRVSRLRREERLDARKVEAGTGPNVLYVAASAAALDPLRTNAGAGLIWADRVEDETLAGQRFEAREDKAEARTTYDVRHPAPWGAKITGYLFTKSVAAGSFLAGLALMPPARAVDEITRGWALAVPLFATLFLAATSALLIADLKRPERFLSILFHPNWSSWLVRGTWALLSFGALLGAWLLLWVLRIAPSGAAGWALVVPTAVAALLSAGYTGWLFGQSKGRVLWMRRGLWLHFMVQALVAGSAFYLLADPLLRLGADALRFQAALLAVALALHLILTLGEGALAPRGREREYARALDLVKRGPYARLHWGVGVLAGAVLPALLLLLPGFQPLAPLCGALALAGLWVEEDVLVRAGQALPIS
jgi:Fe-S-cluster-containing dehydrogenase component/formate-dependent nitrite reductase membrane component NrfD